MIVLLNRQRHRRDGIAEKFRNFRKFPRLGVACTPSLVCSWHSLARLSRSVVKIRDYSQSNKEISYVTLEFYLLEELLTEHIVPGYLNHTIYVDINFLIFSLPLCCYWFLLMASCVETIEMKVMHLCFFTFTDEIVVL